LPTKPSASRLGYRPELDGLRGVAILLVVLIHATGWPRGGLLGVDIFFTLSGFLITTLLLEEWQAYGSISLGRFYLRRYFRLFPALAVFIGGYVLFVALVAQGDQPLRLRSAAFGITYLANWVMAFDRPFAEGEIGHLWSLSVEEQFYLLWPVILVAFLKLRLSPGKSALLVAAMIVAVVSWRTFLDLSGSSDSRMYFATDTRFDQLLIGCLLAIGYVRAPELLERAKRFLVPTAMGAIIFLVWRFLSRNLVSSWSFKVGLTVFAAATAIVICACVTNASPALKRVLSAKWLVSLGLISYSLYLWHPAVYTFVTRFTPAAEWSRFVSIPLEISLSIAAAVASYRLVELPFLRKRRHLQRLLATKARRQEGTQGVAGNDVDERTPPQRMPT
jgi:peptidoglycan/LPS O-acetylase OafA/YrhL